VRPGRRARLSLRLGPGKGRKGEGAGWLGFGSWVGLLATRPRGEGKRGDLGPREEGFVFIILFSFLLFQTYSKTS